jgi:hypothetical protein
MTIYVVEIGSLRSLDKNGIASDSSEGAYRTVHASW